jgi:stalled ribosome alternative rescue factor ArfA
LLTDWGGYAIIAVFNQEVMMKKNPVAKALRSPHLRTQAVKPKRGRGSYNRKRKKLEREFTP